MSENIYKLAVRQGIYFDSPKGVVTLQQAFTLPLTSETGKVNLNELAITVNKELEAQNAGSFVKSANPSAYVRLLTLKLELLKDIIETIETENAVRRQNLVNNVQRQRLEQALANRQQANLESMTEEQLREELAKLS